MSENNEFENEKSFILYQLYAMLFEIDVSKEGVGGAKNFFEAKVKKFLLCQFWFIIEELLFRQLQFEKAINFIARFAKNKNNDVVLKTKNFVVN
jgi:hypothetical protein